MKAHAIFGPPGTGKTEHLVNLTKQRAFDGDSVLFLSFTRAAAQEALSRLPQGLPIQASTIHSLAFNVLRMTRAAVVDRAKLAAFGTTSGFPFMGTEQGSDEPQEGDEYATVLAFANNRLMDPMVAYDRFGCPGTRHRFELFVKAYVDWKKTYGYMDFDDMIKSFIERGMGGAAYSPQVVMLDEAQDCSPLQWKALEVVARDVLEVYVAGDDDQAIYEWNGANPHGMVEFVDRHRGNIEILKESHRVPRRVHKMVHDSLISKIKRRHPKPFSPRQVAGDIHRFGDFTDIDLYMFARQPGLVLCRDNWRLKEIQREFNRQMIPYNVLGGYSPWTSKIAQALKKGDKPDIPPMWRDFYEQADLTKPVNVSLSTIHQAKGRESPSVIVDLSLSTRVLNNYDTDPDAEIRVQYVACTRTSNELILCSENPLL